MTRPARRHPHGRLVRLAVALAAISACASAAALDIQLPGNRNAAPRHRRRCPKRGPMPDVPLGRLPVVAAADAIGFLGCRSQKMVGTYGAPIPAEQVPLIVQYLNQAYPPPQPAGSPKP